MNQPMHDVVPNTIEHVQRCWLIQQVHLYNSVQAGGEILRPLANRIVGIRLLVIPLVQASNAVE